MPREAVHVDDPDLSPAYQVARDAGCLCMWEWPELVPAAARRAETHPACPAHRAAAAAAEGAR